MFKKVVSEIKGLDSVAMGKTSSRLDSLIKPIGSLGRLEDIAIQVSGITGKLNNKINKKCTVVMSADNGVCEEGVSACPQSITLLQTLNFTKGIAGINVLSKHAGAEVKIVDIGINGDVEHPGIINKKIRKGTGNMSREAAMTRDEAVKAIEVGIEIVNNLASEGCDLLGTGEMGIGNTSTSSAILMALTGCSAEVAVGKGAGLSEEDYSKKKKTIETAISFNNPEKSDALDVLSKVGGLDIAGLVGCYLGAAFNRLPIVIDGFISAAAALVAYRINPLTKDYMIPSHESAEPGYILIMKEIGLEPILKLNMRLGEGTGCPLAFNIIEASLAVVNNMATFEEASFDGDFLVDIR